MNNFGDGVRKRARHRWATFPQEKHKRDLQHEAKLKAAEAAEHDKQETTEAQHHPISGHPATAEHPASSGTIEVKAK
jgi:hypothetical protein